MPAFHANPDCEAFLRRHGLTDAAAVLRLPGVVCGGHPDRHVARVTLPGEPGSFYLKREHRVPLRDRLANRLAGFGCVSKSLREYAVLRKVDCGPEPVAAGEDSQGRAFLLLREVSGARELRTFLAGPLTPRERQALARQLGVTLARLHKAGYDHADLYSKHVLVRQGGDRTVDVAFLDWQRSRRHRRVSWPHRCRDLAALHATLAAELVSRADRVWCFQAYCDETNAVAADLKRILRAIERHAQSLLRRRRVREMRQPPAPVTQSLVWIDGEALCVTPAFQDACGGTVPAWLNDVHTSGRVFHARQQRQMPDGTSATLTTALRRNWFARLAQCLRGSRATSPELAAAGLLFRLERYGLRVPRLLAVGQMRVSPWLVSSFLLTEDVASVTPLTGWLDTPQSPGERRKWLLALARWLRQLHDAGCVLTGEPRLAVGPAADIVLTDPLVLRSVRRVSATRAVTDLRWLSRSLGQQCSRTDWLRLVRGYLGNGRLRGPFRRLLREVMKPRTLPQQCTTSQGGRKDDGELLATPGPGRPALA